MSVESSPSSSITSRTSSKLVSSPAFTKSAYASLRPLRVDIPCQRLRLDLVVIEIGPALREDFPFGGAIDANLRKRSVYSEDRERCRIERRRLARVHFQQQFCGCFVEARLSGLPLPLVGNSNPDRAIHVDSFVSIVQSRGRPPWCSRHAPFQRASGSNWHRD